FPPKVGGIQSYLWELWRRLPADQVTVLTSPHADADRFDANQPFRIERVREPVLLPSPLLSRRIRHLAAEVGAAAVVLDPALPLALVGPGLGLPYGVVLHGAEVAVPGRLPASRHLLARVVGAASLLIAAGTYPEAETRRAVGPNGSLPPVVQVPPGVDTARFVPLPYIDRLATRARLGLPASGHLVVSVSRLVPRKGMDTLVDAAAVLAPSHPDLLVAIAGAGRDRGRLEHRIRRRGAPVRLLGRVSDVDLPALYACADLFAMSCRTRWRGLEQEGFGIVFLEAAAAGVPSVAGDSGGAAEAVVDGETGVVVRRPDDPDALAGAIGRLLDDPDLASRQGQAARRRAETEYGYEQLTARLGRAIDAMGAPPAT
ncbi:MAG TPA: glycosyltransferase family 4 protein, partial [Acidimicrobiales bacterium]|nr:glycosyltransferase family 4 protein [Acidimicrobiales bacterium]